MELWSWRPSCGDASSAFSMVGTSTVWVVRSRSISSSARSGWKAPTITVAAPWKMLRSMCMTGTPAAGMACSQRVSVVMPS